MMTKLTFSKVFCAAFLFQLTAACAQPQTGEPVKDEAQAGEVEEFVQDLIAADNNGDLDRVLTHYAEDAILIAPSGSDVTGKEDIRVHYSQLFDRVSLSIVNEPAETVIAGNWAIARGVNYVAATSKSDSVTTHAESKYLMTLRYEPAAGWQIVHLMWSNQNATAE